MKFFDDCVRRVERAAALTKVDPKLVEELCRGGKVIDLKFPAMTRNGKQYFEAVRVHQINPHEAGQPHPFKGGWRYADYASKEEMVDVTKTLALDMTDKILLSGLPFAGAKGCVNINPAKFDTDELWSITNALTVEMLVNNILDANIDVPGPDAGTNAEIMKWIYRFYGKLNRCLYRPNAAAVVTGKPVDFDGCPGREDATARGGLIVYSKLVKNKSVPRIAVQGYGNVGRNSCKLISDESFEYAAGKLVAVSDAFSGLYNPAGIDYASLDKYYSENKIFKGCKLGDEIPPEKIIEAGEYDLFITAAKEGLVNKANAHLLNATCVLELGNSAVTDDADEILGNRNILVIPDILCNSGGVIVSSFEWRKNRGDILHEVDINGAVQWVHEELEKILVRAIKNVLKTQEKYKKTSLRLAAKIFALNELDHMIKRKNA